MNINPYYGVMASGGAGRPGAPHFAGFPFAQCPDPGFPGGGDFYGKHHYHHPQNGAVHQLVKHSAQLASSVANGNNNNNAAVVDGEEAIYGRECNGKLASGYGDAIHAMHVGSPPAGYTAYRGTDPGGSYRSSTDDHAALTPSPHRPALPRAQWSPSPALGAPTTSSSDPYKLSPETAHNHAPATPASTATHGLSAAASYDDAVPVPMASPPPAASRPPQQSPQQCSVGHTQPIPYYPWMGVVGMYIITSSLIQS